MFICTVNDKMPDCQYHMLVQYWLVVCALTDSHRVMSRPYVSAVLACCVCTH